MAAKASSGVWFTAKVCTSSSTRTRYAQFTRPPLEQESDAEPRSSTYPSGCHPVRTPTRSALVFGSPRQFDVQGRRRVRPFTLAGPKNLGQPRVRRQPRSGLGRWPLGPQIGAVPPRVHVRLVLHLAGCASQFERPRPGPKPRVRSADPRRRLCDSRRRSSRPRPDQESPIDPAQGRARGQTTPPLARPLQNQPSRLVDGVPAREGASLSRLQAINPPAPTKTRKLRLFRQTRLPRMRTAMGLQSATR